MTTICFSMRGQLIKPNFLFHQKRRDDCDFCSRRRAYHLSSFGSVKHILCEKTLTSFQGNSIFELLRKWDLPIRKSTRPICFGFSANQKEWVDMKEKLIGTTSNVQARQPIDLFLFYWKDSVSQKKQCILLIGHKDLRTNSNQDSQHIHADQTNNTVHLAHNPLHY